MICEQPAAFRFFVHRRHRVACEIYKNAEKVGLLLGNLRAKKSPLEQTRGEIGSSATLVVQVTGLEPTRPRDH